MLYASLSLQYIQVLELLAELISSKLEFLPLEVSVRSYLCPTSVFATSVFFPTLVQSLASKHPDVKSNHILAVLAMRGDLGRAAVTKVTHLSHGEVNLGRT